MLYRHSMSRMYASHACVPKRGVDVSTRPTAHKELPKRGDTAASPTGNVQPDRVDEMAMPSDVLLLQCPWASCTTRHPTASPSQ